LEELPAFPHASRAIRGSSPASTRSESPARPIIHPEYLVTEQEVSRSFLSATLTTIQPLPDHKTLLTIAFNCHPAPSRRFENATVTWHITEPNTPSVVSSPSSSIMLEKDGLSPHPALNPKIIGFAPNYSVGGWTEEQTRLMWGVHLPVQVGPGIASAGVEPSVERETSKAVLHAMTIQGSVRSSGSRAVWTVIENSSSQRGIPSNFQLAVVVQQSSLFQMDLDIKAELSGPIFNTNIVAKKGKDNNYSRIIDPELWKCGEVTLEPGEAGWRKYLSEFTGEVPGAGGVEFQQKIAGN